MNQEEVNVKQYLQDHINKHVDRKLTIEDYLITYTPFELLIQEGDCCNDYFNVLKLDKVFIQFRWDLYDAYPNEDFDIESLKFVTPYKETITVIRYIPKQTVNEKYNNQKHFCEVIRLELKNKICKNCKLNIYLDVSIDNNVLNSGVTAYSANHEHIIFCPHCNKKLTNVKNKTT